VGALVVGLERSQAAAALGFAAAGALAVWLILLALLAAATRTKRPEPQPAGLELGGDEPPAVVNMIASGWKVHGEAMSSTLVDLAARHVVSFERETDGRLLVRLGHTSAEMTPYEKKVLDLVKRAATHGVVPVEALTLGTDSQASSFQKGFAKTVVADARERGLSRTRWSAAVTTLVGIVALAPSLLAAGAVVTLPDAHNTSSSSSNDDPVSAFIAVALVAWIALMTLFHKLRADRDTPRGLEVAGRWLGLRENLLADGTFPSLPPTAVAIWDRYLSYAVALGVAATTERSLPLGAESDTEAWSSVGGRWRIVRVRYPRRVPPGWGRPPWKIVFAGLFSVAGSAAIGWFLLPAIYQAQADLLKDATTQDHRIAVAVGLGIAAVGFGLAVVFLRGVWMLMIGLADLGRARWIEGRVLRVRTRNNRTYVAVDDGTATHVAAWVSTVGGRQGTDVRIRVATHAGYVRQIDVTGAGVAAPLDGQAVGFAQQPAGEPLADLFSGPAAAHATPLTLDAAWVSSLVGVPLETAAGARLQGPHGLMVGGVLLDSGATAAFTLINQVPFLAHDHVEGLGDEAVKIRRISGVAARAGDRGVLVFVRGGKLDDAKRYDAGEAIARWALSGSTPEPSTTT
jgi:hypothetical protein